MTDKQLLSMYRLKNVIRYNTKNKLKDESVAEHSFYVALIVLKLCKEYEYSEETTQLCLIKAILHDMPEIELNDITHDVKEHLHLRPLLKEYEDDYYKREFTEYADLMIKPQTFDTIVDLADAYSVRQYCLNEISLGNHNSEINAIYNESKDRIISLESKVNKDYIERIIKKENKHDKYF